MESTKKEKIGEEKEKEIVTAKILTYETALIFISDWHSCNDSVKPILETICSLASRCKSLIVCFNGDNEDITYTCNTWIFKQGNIETAFFSFVSNILKLNTNIKIVSGLGNHELGLNPIGAKDGFLLSKYIRKLREIGGERLHIVNTELKWKDEYLNKLYELNLLERVCVVDGIYFGSAIDPYSLKREFAEEKSNSLGHAYKRGRLYQEFDTVTNFVGSINEFMETVGDKQSVLLAHSGLDTLTELYHHMKIGKNTIVIAGHKHREIEWLKAKDAMYPRITLHPSVFGSGIFIGFSQDGKWDYKNFTQLSTRRSPYAEKKSIVTNLLMKLHKNSTPPHIQK